MNAFILLVSIALLAAANRCYVMAQVHVTSKEEKDWFGHFLQAIERPRHTLTQLLTM